MKQYKTHQLIFILTPFVFAFAFGLDIYIPVIPQMTEIFNTTPALIHLTLSLFLLITGVGQLFVGPLSDQFGRKKIFYISSFLFMIGSIACAFSEHINMLILSRAISSFGACGMLVTSFALVRDLFHEEESAKMYSLLNGAIGISPTFAPIIGGYLSHYLGWQSIFIFLGAIGLSALAVTKYFIQETLSVEKRVKINLSIFKRYKNIFSNQQFIIYASLAGFAEAILFCFFSISPFIIIGLHGIATKDFGLYFAVFGAVIALGGFFSAFLIARFGVKATIYIGISLMFLGGTSMLLCNFIIMPCLPGFLIPMAIACTGSMFLVGASASCALEPFPQIAGTASAAFGALEFTIASFFGSVLMRFSTLSTTPYALFIIVLSFLSLLFFLKLQFFSKKGNPTNGLYK